MIRSILFDMGNVLLRFDRELFLDRIGAEGEDRELLMREVFLSREWVMQDRGDLDEPESERRMRSRLPEHLHGAVHELTSRWDQPLIPIDGMQELVEELKAAGYGVYLLSNASRRQHEYWPRLPASRFFDGTLISADHGVIKPDAAIYRLCLEKFGLRAEECVFVDDMPANVAGAERCGIRSFCFGGDAAALRAFLRGEGVRIRE